MPPKVRAVFVKELRDALRDRRTIFAVVVVPLVWYPLVLLGIGEVAQMAKGKLEREVYDVAVPQGMRAFFDKLARVPEEASAPSGPRDEAAADNGEPRKAPALDFKEMAPADAEKALAASSIRAAVSLPRDIEALLAAQQPVAIEVQYDQAEHRSRDAAHRVERLFENYKRHLVSENLKAQKLKREFLDPFALTLRNTAQAAKVGGSLLGVFLPLMFIMMIITGAIHPAVDMTAGERERSTLETLVSAPVRPIEIITGKFLAVSVLAMGTAALNVGSFAASFVVLLSGAKTAGLQFPWSALPLTLLLLIPLALFFSGLLLAVASFATNQKEAQVYCLPVLMLPLLGVMVITVPGLELEGPLLLAPVVNTAFMIRELFLYHGTAQQIVFVFVSTCLYAAGTLALAARIFAREEVLFAAQGSLRLFLKRRFLKPSPEPRPGDAFLIVALLFPINFYFQLWLGKALLDPVAGLRPEQFTLLVVLPQYLLFLGLPLAAAWYLKLDMHRTFQWRRPPPGTLLGGMCLGCGSWLIAQQLVSWQSYVWPYTPGEMAALEKALAPLSQSAPGIALLIFLIGLTPAICEEHLFRGFLLQGLRRSGKWTALLCAGLIFGAYHFPLFKQPVVMLLGVTIAYVAWKARSIWPAVVFHFFHNSLSLLGPALLGLKGENAVAGEPLPGVPLPHLAQAVVLTVIGLWLVRRSRPEDAGSPS